ncbi:MAG: HDIG domain-containing protein, partial [Planctomycetia bacterium]|nr:HDIG domain-containing protein [Planctomycetia bacterium]
IAELTEAKKFDPHVQQVWREFQLSEAEAMSPLPPTEAAKREAVRRQQFESFRAALAGEWRLKYGEAVKKALADLEERGLLDKLPDSGHEQNRAEIIVYSDKDPTAQKPVAVEEVRIADVKPNLLANLRRELKPLQAEVYEQTRRQAKQAYVLNPEPLDKLQTRLLENIATLQQSATFDEATAKLWRDFLPKPTDDTPLPSADEQRKQFEKFRDALAAAPAREALKVGVAKVLGDYEKSGLLVRLKGPDEAAEGNQDEILVYSSSKDTAPQTVKVSTVRLTDVGPKLRAALEHELKSPELAARIYAYFERELPSATTLDYQPPKVGEGLLAVDPALADRTYAWIEHQLKPTLEPDQKKTDERWEAAARDIKPEEHDKQYKLGEKLVEAGKPLTPLEMGLLVKEQQARVSQLSAVEMLERTLAVLGMYLALYTLCGFFLYYRYPGVLADARRFGGLLALCVLTVSLCYWLDTQRAEMVPLLLFGMTVAIAYHQELALLLLAAVGLVVVLSLGHGLATFVTLMAAGATSILLLRRIRSRMKLVNVGVIAGFVGMLTTIGVAVVDGQTPGRPLLQMAGLAWIWGVTAGFAMTGLLPFIEHIFGVLTEISLLELGDVAHPLLQELVRRAPGTYNHSINVASMAEAAAERIGAQGLLTRVGAYFHDIGKILKPEYFAENQSKGDNRHESLVPAMSTLIIIAHVKDGADLARQHHLPRPIIDFIQQHHGTTLVEYFFRRASQQSGENPDAQEVDENAFRYPGPKPLSKEAGILMLADAVESASRVLVEPTPSRIENLVQQLTMNRLLDGQFDDCGLTLQEVHTVQESLVKSLTAVYHGRVKYPEPLTA